MSDYHVIRKEEQAQESCINSEVLISYGQTNALYLLNIEFEDIRT